MIINELRKKERVRFCKEPQLFFCGCAARRTAQNQRASRKAGAHAFVRAVNDKLKMLSLSCFFHHIAGNKLWLYLTAIKLHNIFFE
jgi:hypothetical protein